MISVQSLIYSIDNLSSISFILSIILWHNYLSSINLSISNSIFSTHSYNSITIFDQFLLFSSSSNHKGSCIISILCWDSALEDLLCPQTMLPSLMNRGINNKRSFTNLLVKIEIMTILYFKITSLPFTFSLKPLIHWYTLYLHHLQIHHFILWGIFMYKSSYV